MGLEPEHKAGSILGEGARAWFNLTVGEQRALVIVLGLFLLGVAARAWHLHEKACRMTKHARCETPSDRHDLTVNVRGRKENGGRNLLRQPES